MSVTSNIPATHEAGNTSKKTAFYKLDSIAAIRRASDWSPTWHRWSDLANDHLVAKALFAAVASTGRPGETLRVEIPEYPQQPDGEDEGVEVEGVETVLRDEIDSREEGVEEAAAGEDEDVSSEDNDSDEDYSIGR